MRRVGECYSHAAALGVNRGENRVGDEDSTYHGAQRRGRMQNRCGKVNAVRRQ